MDTLSIKNLSKTYSNGVQALKSVSLEIPIGMYGLLGPNGAGKSTLMRTLATLQEADKGEVRLGNLDVLKQKEQVRNMLGYLPQEFGVYPRVSAEALLNHLAVLKGIVNRKERKEVIEALLHKTNLYSKRKKNLGGYSGGMKQRFGIAQALLANPKLIIVDEPTAGLDPAERNRFYNLLSEIGQNTVVILSTHIVEDVKELCNSMAIINQGEVLATGNPQQLIQQLEGRVYRKVVKHEHLELYKQHHHVISSRLLQGKPVIDIISKEDPGDGFAQRQADLEDVYFSHVDTSH